MFNTHLITSCDSNGELCMKFTHTSSLFWELQVFKQHRLACTHAKVCHRSRSHQGSPAPQAANRAPLEQAACLTVWATVCSFQNPAQVPGVCSSQPRILPRPAVTSKNSSDQLQRIK